MFSIKRIGSGNPDARLFDARYAIPIVASFAAVVFFWSLGEAPYWDRDEPRNAGCAVEMLTRGDWIVPTFNSELRGQKPVLLYWLMMVSYHIFGINEFAGRFASALLATGTVIATWGIARSFFDRQVAMLAACVLATSLMFGVAARAATPDSLLIFCVTTALWVFSKYAAVRSTSEARTQNPFSNRFAACGIYAMLGFAMLAKGPVGLILPLSVMGWFLLQRSVEAIEPQPLIQPDRFLRRAAKQLVKPFHPANFIQVLFSMRPVAGIALSLTIAAPWFIAVGFATDGEFIRRFFLDENFGRAMNSFENHSGGIWFYPLAILVGFFPWSTFWGPVVADLGIGAFRKKKIVTSPTLSQSGIRLCIFWIVIQVIAFSLVQTKLPSYVTPCYPALAILTANAVVRNVRHSSSAPTWLWKLAHGSLVFSGLAIIAAAWFASTKFDFVPVAIALTGMFPVAMGIAGLCLSRKQTSARQQQPASVNRLPALQAIGAAAFCVSLLGIGAASIGKQNELTIPGFLQRQNSNAIVASYGCLESSWVYYSEKPIIELRIDQPSSNVAPFSYNTLKSFWRPKPRPFVEQLVQSNSESYIVTTEELLPELKNRLPEEWCVLRKADWFLRDKQLVVVGVPSQVARKPPAITPVPDANASLKPTLRR